MSFICDPLEIQYPFCTEFLDPLTPQAGTQIWI